MVNFIVVDDNPYNLESVISVVNNVMMENNMEYDLKKFLAYDDDFLEVVKSGLPNKIYLLDIETKGATGVDMARLIRKTDANSVIIFVTIHDDVGGSIMRDQLIVLSLVSKVKKFEEELTLSINLGLAHLGQREVIKFTDSGSLFIIPVESILYITRDSIERKVIIKTDNFEFKVSKNLSDICKLSHSLVQSHRSCLINKKRAIKYDFRHNNILFDNGSSIDMLSDFYKKGLG